MSTEIEIDKVREDTKKEIANVYSRADNCRDDRECVIKDRESECMSDRKALGDRKSKLILPALTS